MWLTFLNADYLAQVLNLAYEDPVVSMVIVDRLIPRKAFHMPDMIDPTPEVITFLIEGGHVKPTVFTVDADGGDPDLAKKGSALIARFCNAGIPAFPSVSRAARALYRLCWCHSRTSKRGT